MAILTVCSGLSLSTSPTRGSREPFSSQLKRLRPHRAPPRGTELPCWPARMSPGLPSPPAPAAALPGAPGSRALGHRAASEAGTEDALPVPCANDPSGSRRSQGSLSSAIPDSLPLVSALRHPLAAPSWASSGDSPAHPLQPLVLMQMGHPLRKPAGPKAVTPPRRTTRMGPLG